MPLKLTTIRRTTADRAKVLLDRTPKDEVFSSTELAHLLGVTNEMLNGSLARKMPAYTSRYGKQRYWGHQEAIRRLTERTA